MSTWLSLPGGMPRIWHLEAVAPSTGGFAYAACGLRWAPTESKLLERTENLNKIRYEVRCATCNAAFARRAAEPEA
jgi:hypothetical protein